MAVLFDNGRLAFRSLRRRPTFAATVILTLAVGIGATTAAFALVDAVFLTRLPVQDQARLVVLSSTPPSRWAASTTPWPVPWGVGRVLAEQHRGFADVAGVWTGAKPSPYAARYHGRTIHVGRASVSGNFFQVLGVEPAVGRLLEARDDVAGGPSVVVLGDRLWRTELGGDPHVVGQLLFFEGIPYRIVGVAPPAFSYPAAGTNAWVPAVQDFYARLRLTVTDDQFGCFLIARLTHGSTPARARTELEAALRNYAPSAKYLDAFGNLPTGGRVERFTDVVLGSEVRPGTLILFGAVVLVLLIACTNVAGLLLARGMARASELAIRASLGATPSQILGYVLTESVLLAAIGGSLGLALAAALVRAAVTAAPAELPMVATAHLDGRVLAFAMTITIASAIGFGVLPALREAHADRSSAARTGNRSITGGLMVGRARRALVAAQVALALVVLSGAGLLGDTMVRLETTPLGFDPDHVMLFRLDNMLPSSPARDTTLAWHNHWLAVRDQLVERIPATPGLGPMTATMWVPFNNEGNMELYTVDGRLPGPNEHTLQTYWNEVLDDYFGVMEIPIIRGRTLTRADDAHAPPVIVVNEAFARQTWPGQDPVGHRVRFVTDSLRWFTVVGLARDSRYNDLTHPSRPTAFVQVRQDIQNPWLAVRARSDSTHAATLLESVVQSVEPAFSVSEIATASGALRTRLARPRALAVLFAALSGTALFLAAIGLFGVLAAYVRERRREIAVRAALGATPHQLRGLVLGQTLGVASLGVACGVPLALGGSHILRVMVSDVRPVDALTIIVVAGILLAVVALATYGPMARAARVDARTALAAE